jgi:hypothetical protein
LAQALIFPSRSPYEAATTSQHYSRFIHRTQHAASFPSRFGAAPRDLGNLHNTNIHATALPTPIHSDRNEIYLAHFGGPFISTRFGYCIICHLRSGTFRLQTVRTQSRCMDEWTPRHGGLDAVRTWRPVSVLSSVKALAEANWLELSGLLTEAILIPAGTYYRVRDVAFEPNLLRRFRNTRMLLLLLN